MEFECKHAGGCVFSSAHAATLEYSLEKVGSAKHQDSPSGSGSPWAKERKL